MTITKEQIKTWATGNGCPCRGDVFEGFWKDELYRAEFYGEIFAGSSEISMQLATESPIEKKVGDTWVRVDCSLMSDDDFNNLISSITLVVTGSKTEADMIKTNITVTLFNFKDNKEEYFYGWDDDVTLIDRVKDALNKTENEKIPCLITTQNMEKNKDGKYIGKANIINVLSACCNDGSNWVEKEIILDKIKEILK